MFYYVQFGTLPNRFAEIMYLCLKHTPVVGCCLCWPVLALTKTKSWKCANAGGALAKGHNPENVTTPAETSLKAYKESQATNHSDNKIIGNLPDGE